MHARASNTKTSPEKAARLLVVEDDEPIRGLLRYIFQSEGYEVVEAVDGQEGLEIIRSTPLDLVLTDVRMPRMDGLTFLRALRRFDDQLPVVLLTAHSSVDEAVLAMKEGADDYLEKPIDRLRLLSVVGGALERAELRAKAHLFDHPPEADSWNGLTGRSDKMRWVFHITQRLARFNAPVLLCGESGTGKELVARALHELGPRAKAPFVAVNCAGLSDGLFESLLFGHARGSFSGALRDHDGYVERAHGGTLFLDEIGELSSAGQAKLLRTIETGEVEAVGGRRPRHVDFRVVSATNRDLVREIDAGRFRRDLYHRLCGAAIELPPLRDRGDDVALLARHFLAEVCAEHDLVLEGFTPAARQALETHPWPGNVRELRQVVRTAAVMARSARVELADLPDSAFQSAETATAATVLAPAPPSSRPDSAGRMPSLAEVEANHIRLVLEETDGNRSAAARTLGVSRHTLYRLLKKHGVAVPRAEPRTPPSTRDTP